MFTRSKKLGRLFSVLMVAVLLVSVLCVGAFAEEPAAITTVDITKTLTKNENAYAPATTFTFTVAPSQDTTSYDGKVVYAGVTGGATFATGAGSITFEGGIGQSSMTDTTTISLNASVFSAPGIYHYTVTETAGSYDGIRYDTTARDLYVYVRNATSGTGYEVYAAILVKGTAKTDNFENTYTTNDLTITKTVTGNQGDKNKAFSFTVKVDGAEGEQYKIVVNNGTAEVLTSGTAKTITLTHGQSAVIYGLSANDTYTVTEANYSDDGYTTTIGGETTRTATGKISANTTVTVVNDKNVSTPTGVLMNIAPYAIMIVLAGACAVLFLRKKNHEA